MTGFFVVPDSLHNAITAKLDAAIAEVPDAEKDRDHLYRELLSFFNDHGSLPDFTLAKVQRVTAEGIITASPPLSAEER